jgi:hypothetical protein
MGEGDLTASNQFMTSILSGDPTKVTQALAPQIAGIQGRTQQEKNTVAQFGGRSGGTAATTAGLDTAAKGDVTNLVGSLTGNAASSLASTGSNLLSTGLAGNQAAFGEADTLHQQNLAKINDIIKSITSVAAAPFTGGASLTSIGAPSGMSMPAWLKNMFSGSGDGSQAPYGPNSD